jgi:hypothetical protein
MLAGARLSIAVVSLSSPTVLAAVTCPAGPVLAYCTPGGAPCDDGDPCTVDTCEPCVPFLPGECGQPFKCRFDDWSYDYYDVSGYHLCRWRQAQSFLSSLDAGGPSGPLVRRLKPMVTRLLAAGERAPGRHPARVRRLSARIVFIVAASPAAHALNAVDPDVTLCLSRLLPAVEEPCLAAGCGND